VSASDAAQGRLAPMQGTLAAFNVSGNRPATRLESEGCYAVLTVQPNTRTAQPTTAIQNACMLINGIETKVATTASTTSTTDNQNVHDEGVCIGIVKSPLENVAPRYSASWRRFVNTSRNPGEAGLFEGIAVPAAAHPGAVVALAKLCYFTAPGSSLGCGPGCQARSKQTDAGLAQR
jgi:hypothetical protein